MKRATVQPCPSSPRSSSQITFSDKRSDYLVFRDEKSLWKFFVWPWLDKKKCPKVQNKKKNITCQLNLIYFKCSLKKGPSSKHCVVVNSINDVMLQHLCMCAVMWGGLFWLSVHREREGLHRDAQHYEGIMWGEVSSAGTPTGQTGVWTRRPQCTWLIHLSSDCTRAQFIVTPLKVIPIRLKQEINKGTAAQTKAQ